MPWQTKPPLAEKKIGIGAVTAVAPDGAPGSRVYAIGGWTGFANLNTVEVFDTQTNDWSPAAPMPTARSAFGTAVQADRIHAIGGIGGPDNDPIATHEVYDPASNSWSSSAPMPTARYHVKAVAGPDGQIYVIGGLGSSTYATVEVYDPVSDTWSTGTPMPTARQGLAAVLGPDGLIYAIAGFRSPNTYAIVETYDPSTGVWQTAIPIPVAVTWPDAAVGTNGLIYVMGGRDVQSTARHDVYSYDPANPAVGWSTRAPMLMARSDVAAATGPDGLVYAMGGFDTESGNSFHNSVEAYTFARGDGFSFDNMDVADILKQIGGRTVGGVDRGGGGGIIVNGHYIPIPPRSPVWAKIIGAAQPYLANGVDSPQLAQLVAELALEVDKKVAGQAATRTNLGKRAGGSLT